MFPLVLRGLAEPVSPQATSGKGASVAAMMLFSGTPMSNHVLTCCACSNVARCTAATCELSNQAKKRRRAWRAWRRARAKPWQTSSRRSS